tara:strand:- start:886 stop:1659 length:774 start_codon:yes stop_codon:yes gene_type:complete
MKLEDKISNWLKRYLTKNNLETFVVGISGGVDSALTSTLCARTFSKTILITMPIHQNPEETDRGLNHINWLKKTYTNVKSLHIDLTKTYDELINTIPLNMQSDLSLANTRARLRMSTLYLIAGSSKGIVVGTGNKVEDFGIGFFTKYGDGGVDVSPIADLMKSEVYALANDLNINKEIINAAPTDGLWEDGRTDEDQIGVSYDELEWAMHFIENNSNNNMNLLNQKQKSILKVYKSLRNVNVHKMKEIPVFKNNNDS